MNYFLTEEQQMIKDLAAQIAREKIAPIALEYDETGKFPWDIVEVMAKADLFRVFIPKEYDGLGGGIMEMALVVEELSKACGGISLAYAASGLGTIPIILFGSEEQKKKYLPGLCSGELIGCFAITEPDAASDVLSMKATAKKDGDSYILNGSKIWISNAQFADLALVYAYTNKEAGTKGMSAFVVELKNNPGIKTAPLDKMGTRSSPTGEIVFEDARIPASALLPPEGRGVPYVFECLNRTRVSCAAGGVGVAQACLDAATKYCNERKQFGQEIGQFQMNQDLIAQMTVEVEAARLLTYKAAWQKDQGQLGNTLETSMAKYFAGEVAQRASHATMKIYGSYGYSPEYPAARLYRDAVLYQIVEGTANIQKTIIAMDQLGYRKANK